MPSTTSAPATPAQHPARILVAEDDPAAATLLRTVLERAGHEVRVFPEGTGVRAAFEEDDPADLLLLDWMLPGVSGLELLRMARQRWDALSLPILMVTARTDVESIEAAFATGASDYLTKPFLAPELLARVGAHLRTRRLSEERRELEQLLREREALSTIGMVATGIAHDILNPLAALSGLAQLAHRRSREEEVRADLLGILDEVHRCRRIVADVMRFARQNPLERRPVAIGAVLEQALELCGPEVHRSRAETRLQVEDPAIRVRADHQQLQQVFLNLIVNAHHALREGGSRLDVRAGPARGGYVTVDFVNDAPPIGAEVLPRIFEPFFTTKGAGGTGFGLALCRRIVRDHGGEIAVGSGAGETRFAVRLPVEATGDRSGGERTDATDGG